MVAQVFASCLALVGQLLYAYAFVRIHGVLISEETPFVIQLPQRQQQQNDEPEEPAEPAEPAEPRILPTSVSTASRNCFRYTWVGIKRAAISVGRISRLFYASDWLKGMAATIVGAVCTLAALYYASVTLVAVLRISIIPFTILVAHLSKDSKETGGVSTALSRSTDSTATHAALCAKGTLLVLACACLVVAIYETPSDATDTLSIRDDGELWTRTWYLLYLGACVTILFVGCGCCCCGMVARLSLGGQTGALALCNGILYGYFLLFFKMLAWTVQADGGATRFAVYLALFIFTTLGGECTRQCYLSLDNLTTVVVPIVVTAEVFFGTLTSGLFFEELQQRSAAQLWVFGVAVSGAIACVLAVWYLNLCTARQSKQHESCKELPKVTKTATSPPYTRLNQFGI